ncbi:MAG TPA: hypothetical protein VLH60_00475, partial [Sedimentisphaerales bacterium]|nr:hypothetical protein [Sedimentisphaerales bacterium]
MELLRKYSAMFIPVGLVLVAVVLIVATILMGGSLKEQMATSVGHHNTIRTLLNSAVSQRQAEVERDYQDEHQRDAEAFAELTARSSQRPLLAYNMFPAPDAGETSDTIFHNFARAYSAAIDDLVKRMRGGVPHSAAEMAMAT